MYLNRLGERRLVNLILMAAVIILVNVLGFLYAFQLIQIALILIIIPITYYARLSKKLGSHLQEIIYTKLGFVKLANYNLHPYKISSIYNTKIEKAYTGTFNNKKVTVVYFGSHYRTHINTSKSDELLFGFVGLEMKTTSNTVGMQLYDINNPLIPYKTKFTKLESVEFNKFFKVKVDAPQDAFYNLNPDSMWELLQLKKQVDYQINIEYIQDRILVYTDTSSFDDITKKSLSFTEVLNGDISDDDLALYEDAINKLLEINEKILPLLNLKH